jgi:hypothetical protein
MTLDEVTARVELRALVDEYAWRTDLYDYDGYAELFLPDAEITAVNPGETEPFFRAQGYEEIRLQVHGNDQFERTFHAVETHRCTVDGASATGVTYCTAHHLLRDTDPPQTLVMLIRYVDDYSLTDDGWKFASRRIELTWVEYLESDVSPYPFTRGSADWIAEHHG